MLPGRELAFDGGQAEADEVDVLAPGFAVIAGQGGGPGLAVRGGMLLDLLDEDGGRELEVVAQRQALPEDLEDLRIVLIVDVPNVFLDRAEDFRAHAVSDAAWARHGDALRAAFAAAREGRAVNQ
jgi:hypothetical protein